MFLYFDTLTISPILNSGFLLLTPLLESIYVIVFTSTAFILIALCYALSYFLTMSSNLSIYTFFETKVMYL